MSGLSRRAVLAALAAAGLPRAAWAALTPTPGQSTGPFYPVAWEGDVDNDLLRVAGRGDLAGGTVLQLGGRVLDAAGAPLPGAQVEIWQCDAGGIYRHPRDGNYASRDAGFQGFGRAVAAADGSYSFRTLKPVPYTGRTPHIHFAVAAPGRPRLVTQMYLPDEPGNERDFLWRRLGPAERAAATLRELSPASGGIAGRFDLVLA